MYMCVFIYVCLVCVRVCVGGDWLVDVFSVCICLCDVRMCACVWHVWESVGVYVCRGGTYVVCVMCVVCMV